MVKCAGGEAGFHPCKTLFVLLSSRALCYARARFNFAVAAFIRFFIWSAILDIEVSNFNDARLIKLTGRLTMGDAVDRLRRTFEDLMGAGSCRLVLDLADVAMVDSSGIGLLVKSMTVAKQKGGALKLLNPRKFTVQTLKMIGVLNLFELFEDPQVALSSFK